MINHLEPSGLSTKFTCHSEFYISSLEYAWSHLLVPVPKKYWKKSRVRHMQFSDSYNWNYKID